MLQVINHTIGGVNTPKGKENPCPKPEKLPGPADWQSNEEDEEE